MRITAYDIASRFTGMAEVPGKPNNPSILAMLKLDNDWPEGDEVAWCSAFANYVAWLLRLPRSKSLRARSWLKIGIPVSLQDATRGWDVVILKRGEGEQPGPEVTEAPGHVGFYASQDHSKVYLLGGNQGDQVSVAGFPQSRILGIRRLWEPEPDSRS